LGNIHLPSIPFDRQQVKAKKSSDSDLAKGEPTGLLKIGPSKTNQRNSPFSTRDQQPQERLHRWPVQHLSTAEPDFDGEINAAHVLRAGLVCRECGTRLKPTMNPSSFFTKITDLT